MSVKASSEGIQKVRQCMAELVRPNNHDEKGWTIPDLAERSGAGESTVKRFLKGIPVKLDSLVWITGAVGLKPEDVIDAPLNETEASIVNWIVICGEMLANQKEDRQLRKESTAIGAEVNVYVPLDLLEHKEQTRSKQDKADSDQRNQYQERKVVKTYEHDDFLGSLTDRQSKNKHIAIVGEAGAGKTTLLARIADELDKNQKLQIFVSLADLQGRSLEDHIYGKWLSEALCVQKDSISGEQKHNLFQQFQSGEIWLLLDGLDEMRAKSSADALEKINREIREVIGQSRVVLTSRLNVWDAHLNRLSGFDTFRMGDFSPEQVDKFIGDWFVCAEKPESAPILQAKLKEPNRDRIRDMVRHPLRLALLCQAFYRDLNTELPETKAGLYELFVRYFYEWKPNIVDEDLIQDTLREELHQALGKLAIAGIDSDAGFRLSRSLAVKEMGDRLFKLASDVGWLTLIERDEQDQEVYAFYHQSFQEYFAALAITNWKFFLHISINMSEPENYRVFDKKWEEVILFWVGNTEKNKEIQDFIDSLVDFETHTIVDIFYKIQGDFIAAKCISEFKNYYQSKLVLENLIDRHIGFLDLEKKVWITTNNIKESKVDAKVVFRYIGNQLYQEIANNLFERLSYPCLFQDTDMDDVFNNRKTFLEYSGFIIDKMTRIEIASEIINISKNNNKFKQSVIDRLKLLLDNRHESQIRIACAYAVLKLDTESNIGRDELIKLKDNSIYESVRETSEKILNKKDYEYRYDSQAKNENLASAIDQLKNFKVAYEIKNVTPQLICQLSWYKLIVDELYNLAFIYEGKKEFKVSQSDPLSTIFEDLNLKDFLVKIMLDIIESGIWSLNTIIALPVLSFGSQRVINALENFIEQTNNLTLNDYAAKSLGKIDHGNQKAISTILQYIKKTIEQLEINPDLTDTDNNDDEIKKRERFGTNWRDSVSVDLYCLKYVSNNDYSIIISLYDLLKDTTDPEIKLNISKCIVSFDPLNSLAISYLVYFFAKSEDYSIATKALTALIECLGWEEALNYTVDYFPSRGFYGSDYWEDVCSAIKEQISIQEIPSFISFLRLHLNICWEFRDLLWHFSHEITYQEFDGAWKPQKSNPDVHSIENQFKRDIVQTNLDLSSDNPEIRCLVVDIRHLEQESDPNVIAKKLTNKIFKSIGRRIPVVQDVSCLERELLNLKFDLGFEKLAIALYGKNANEAIYQLCQSLTDSIQIRPFPEEQTAQKLITKINAWLSEM